MHSFFFNSFILCIPPFFRKEPCISFNKVLPVLQNERLKDGKLATTSQDECYRNLSKLDYSDLVCYPHVGIFGGIPKCEAESDDKHLYLISRIACPCSRHLPPNNVECTTCSTELIATVHFILVLCERYTCLPYLLPLCIEIKSSRSTRGVRVTRKLILI